jgi:LPS-assembly protein
MGSHIKYLSLVRIVTPRKISRVNLILALLCAGCWLCSARAGLAQLGRPSAESGPIDVTADKLSAEDGGVKIEASGNVEIKRDLTTIHADEVRVNRATQDIEAKGRISVDDPEWKIRSADSIQFNLGKETGNIQNGNIFIEQGHVSIMGRRFEKFTGQVYRVDDGFFTTCLCESGRSPWRFSADQMDLSADGLGIIRNGYFYILDVPVFYLPYGFFPLKTERQTGFLFPKFGSSTKEGYRFQQPFFWAISKSTDATLAFDIETRARVGAIGELRTIFNRDSDFQFRSSYFNETFRNQADESIIDRTIADQRIPQDRWSVVSTHRHLTTNNWLTYSDVAAFRDDLFVRELVDRFDLAGGKEQDIRRSRFGESRFGAFRAWNDAFLRGEWRFYQDFIQPDPTTLQRTPQLTFWGRRFLSGFPLEFNWRAEGINYLRRQGGDGLRLDLRPELALPLRFNQYMFGGLSLAPRETIYHLYSPLEASDRNLSRETVEIRGNIGTSFSRVFSWNVLGLSAFKHVVEPEVSYLFVPGVDQNKIPIMDQVDRIRRRNVLTFAVANRFWGKPVRTFVTGADDKDTELVNPLGPLGVSEMGRVRLALSYDIDRERKGGDSLTDVDMNIRLTPVSYAVVGFDGGIDPGRWQVTQARAFFNISDPRLRRQTLDPDFNRPNSFAISYQFLRDSPLGFLSEDANANLDQPATPAYCGRHPVDPRCNGFQKSIVGNVGTSVLYHATNNILFFLSATYDVREGRSLGVRAATKLLSSCECWSMTFRIGQDINPARTTFNFDFTLLGLGSTKSSLQ